MGNNLSFSMIPPPLSLNDCVVDGELDIARYYIYKRRVRRETNQNAALNAIINRKRKAATNVTPVSKVGKRRRCRSVGKYKLLVRNQDGTLREFLYSDTLWYLMYVQYPPQNNRLRKTFRNRFRLTHDSFVELACDMMNHELFVRWVTKNCASTDPSNIKLLLLGALWYLGRGHTFDDIEEATAISREVNRNFLHTFLKYGSTVLYQRHVIDAACLTAPSKYEKLFAAAGFNGCMGSTDATHVGMLSCTNWAAHNHLVIN